MTLKKVFLLGGFALSAFTLQAQTGVQTGTPFGSGQDSIACRQNLSLLTSFSKANDFASAYEPWQRAYEACPASNINIYIFGPKILNWKYENSKDEASKKAVIDMLMGMYDNRAKYFGDGSSKVTRDAIAGIKAGDYIRLMGANADYKTVYSWLSPIVEEFKERTAPQTLYYYTYASQALARADKEKVAQYIKDFSDANGFLNTQIELANGNEKVLKRINDFKAPMEQSFAQSGLASKEILEKVYTIAEIDKNKDSKDYLMMVVALFEATGSEAPAYYQASRHLFNLEPSYAAAMGLAGEAYSKKDFKVAEEWLKKAIELSKSSKDKAKVYELLADISQFQGNWANVRTYTNQALAENPNSGKSLIRMAQTLANSASSLFPGDAVKQRAVYYLVIDKLQKAASVDPSVSSQANSMIAQYRRLLPTASEIFMHPELDKGQSFTVGSWGTTTIR